MKFGAFIITFNRPEVLEKTIIDLKNQSLAPSQILIIDNSTKQTAKSVYEKLHGNGVSYHATGQNIGPAGAAYFGLKWFKEQGYDWVYWGDDDNPPGINTTFERIFLMIGALNSNSNIGIAGAVGQLYDYSTGKVIRLKDSQLEGFLEVDIMAGASSMVVNLKAIRDETLPEPKLFFGFEEFEFCLKIKNAGFRLVVDGNLMKENREKYGRINFKSRSEIIPKKDALWRQYYSTRNLIYIFFKIYPRYRHIAFYRIVMALGKIITGFGNGFALGLQNARYQTLAISDGLSGRLGFKNFHS